MQNEIHEDGNTSEKSQNANDLVTEIERLKSTNERLLQESSKYKTRKEELNTYKEQLEEYKRKELEQKGNFQEMLEMERNKCMELEQVLENKNKNLMKSNIFNAVSNYAKDAHDVNDLLAQREYSNMIEVDEETLEPNMESIHKFVDSLKENKKYLFKGNKVASMADTKPSVERPTDKPISQMTEAEKRDYLKSQLGSMQLTR